jgi:hypothetical protein
VRLVGASNWQTWRLAEARVLSDVHGWASHTVYEFRHTYLQPEAGANFGAQVVAGPELFDDCRSHSVPLVAYSVLLNGAYTRANRPLDDYGGAENYRKAEEPGLHNALPVIPIVGARHLALGQSDRCCLEVLGKLSLCTLGTPTRVRNLVRTQPRVTILDSEFGDRRRRLRAGHMATPRL